MAKVCSIEGCDNTVLARGWCRKHYQRWWKNGSATPQPKQAVDPLPSFWERISFERDHWMWTGSISPQGYGTFSVSGVGFLAHRWSYEHFVGPIPEGLHIDHLCRVRACVNPAHLEPVTCQVNVLRGVGPTAAHAVKTHCKHGHEFTPENTIPVKGGRRCRECHNRRQRVGGRG